MMMYSNDLLVKDALQSYFSQYHFENGGYDLQYFKIKLGPVFLSFPNTKARIAAVKIHDIHHLVTEYKATLRGEAEIGAWEIASGCGKHGIAWFLNSGSFFYGLFFFPRAVFTAFMSGRKVRTNLYKNIVYDENLLSRTVGSLREYVGINSGGNNTAFDYFYFLFWCFLVLAPAGIALLLLCYLLKL
jgi:hypothetical protein